MKNCKYIIDGWIIFISIYFITIYGCSTLNQLVQKPDIQFYDLKMKDMNLFTATPVFTFQVKNPNPIGIPVKNFTYRLNINQNRFIEGTEPLSVNITPNGTSLVHLPVTVNYMKFFSTISDLMKSKSVNYALEGSLGAGVFTLPYQSKGTFDLPRIPKVELSKVRIKNLSLSGASLVFDLMVKNQNDFLVNMNKLSYNIRLNGKDIMDGLQSDSMTLHEQKSSSISLPINLNFLQIGQSVMSMLSESSANYEVKGAMTFLVPELGLKEIPFKKIGNVPIYQ